MSHSNFCWQAELQTFPEPSSPEDVSTEIASLKLVEVWFITEFVLKGSMRRNEKEKWKWKKKWEEKECPTAGNSETCNILHFSKID